MCNLAYTSGGEMVRASDLRPKRSPIRIPAVVLSGNNRPWASCLHICTANCHQAVLVKAVRGMNVQICTKASNLVHRYILTCWTQICREPNPIFNGVAILDDSKWPLSKNTFLHFWPTNSHRITNKTTFLGFSTQRNPILISE